MTRHISDAGLEAIAREEGFVPRVYRCPAGVPTIGYGHALRPGETWPDGISEADARELLRRDVATAEAAVSTLVQIALAQHEYDALVSFAYNVGAHALRTSTLLRLLNSGDRAGAAAQFARWVRGGPRLARLPVLVARRAREAARFRGELSGYSGELPDVG